MLLLISVLHQQWDNPCSGSCEQGTKGSSVPWQQTGVHVRMGILACGKGRFQFGSSKEDLADSFILKHARHWQQLQVLTEVVRSYIIRGIKC